MRHRIEAVATYDLDGSGGKVHHFDAAGAAVNLAEDRPDAFGVAASTRK
jgi:hypothetical protein